MRIAQISPYDINRPGGVQRHIGDLSAELIKLGHEVTIIAPRVAGKFSSDLSQTSLSTTSVDYVGKGWLVSLNGTQFEISLAIGSELARLDSLIKYGKFDVVHFHTLISPLLPMQVFWRSRCARIATFHNVPPDGKSASIQRFVQGVVGRRLMAHLDDVVLASEVQKNLYALTERSTFPVIPPCVDLRRFFADIEPIRLYVDGRKNILFLGRLEPRKGAIVLLQAFHKLRRHGVTARLLIAGDGPQRSLLEQFVQSHSVPDVVFLSSVPDSDVPRLYATCDIFCAPSLYGEGFGIVIAEAMASGRPIVAASNEGYRMLLRDDAAGFLVRPGDVDETYAKLKRLIIDPQLCRRLGDWGRLEAKRYDTKLHAPQFVSIYERAIRLRRTKIGGGGA